MLILKFIQVVRVGKWPCRAHFRTNVPMFDSKRRKGRIRQCSSATSLHYWFLSVWLATRLWSVNRFDLVALAEVLNLIRGRPQKPCVSQGAVCSVTRDGPLLSVIPQRVKLRRGSLICQRELRKIVEYFKNNVPQCQIEKALQTSSSAVQNIIYRFRETADISVHQGQGPRPLLDDGGLQALRNTASLSFMTVSMTSLNEPASLKVWRSISPYGMDSWMFWKELCTLKGL